MPVIPKLINGRLNYDDSAHLVEKGDFIDALNITREQGAGGTFNDDAVRANVRGNRFVPYNLPGATSKVIGCRADTLRNCVYYFIYNTGNYHTIARYSNSNRTIDTVFQNLTHTANVEVLAFNVNYKINHIDIVHRDEGDLLFWTDALNPPRVINVTTALAGGYTPATALDILVAQAPPQAPPTAEYISDGNVTINNVKGKLFEFAYRFVYDDFWKSTFSELSANPLPANDYQANINPLSSNVINVAFNTGGARVAKVELVGRQNNGNDWSDYFLIESFDKDELGLSDNSTFTFPFTNNGAYISIDVNEAIQLFDYVPLRANAQCLPNGNTIVYGGILEGYDKLTNLDVIAEVTYLNVPLPDGGIVIGNPTFDFTVSQIGFPPYVYRVDFTIGATVTPGDQYNLSFEVSRVPGTSGDPGCFTSPSGIHSFSYTAILGDTQNTVSAYFVSQLNPIDDIVAIDDTGGAFHMQTFPSGCYRFVNIIAQPIPATSVGGGNFFDRIYKFGGKFRFGMVYFDDHGITPGVETYTTSPGDVSDFEVDIAEFNATDTGYKRPIINLTVQHLPPSWAKTFSFVRTKNLIAESFFMWKIDDFQDDGSYFYFGIDNLQTYEAATPNFSSDWTFQTGDRLKACYQFDGTFDTGWGDIYNPVLDYEIVGVVEYNPGSGAKTYIKCQKYPSTITPPYDDNIVFEVYRPALRTDGSLQVYYEFGETYNCVVINGINYHKFQDATTNPIFQFTDGDIYLRIRQGIGDDYLIQDPNFSEFAVSAINSNGRAFVIDENAAQTYNPTLVRFSQSYQFGTNINGLNRFFSENLDEYSRTYGDILKLDYYASYMKVGQRLRIGNVPVELQIIKTASGTDNLTTSDQLLNTIVYYQGDFGVGTAPEAWARNNFVVYGVDNIRGVVWRLSQDGLTILSILYKTNSWATRELPLRTGNSKIYGVYNADVNRYEIALEEATDTDILSVGNETTFGYSGSFQLAVNIEDICNADFQTLHMGEPFAVGVYVFTSSSFVFPVTGYNYIADINGDIYELNTSTGEVGILTGFECNSGISGLYKLAVDIGDVCNAETQTLYSDVAFAEGAFMFYDSALSTPVTGFVYIVQVSTNNIYNIDSLTGEVGVDTTNDCGAGDQFQVDTNILTVCRAIQQTFYPDAPFAPGVTMYTDSGLSTLLTSYDYIIQVSTSPDIYDIDSVTGVVGALAGTCSPSFNTQIINNLTGASIDDTTVGGAAWIIVDTGTFPIGSGSDLTGTHGGFFGVIRVIISGVVAAGSLALYVDSILIECLNVSISGNYDYSSRSYSSGSIIVIELNVGSCP